jgi:hypothetical protein
VVGVSRVDIGVCVPFSSLHEAVLALYGGETRCIEALGELFGSVARRIGVRSELYDVSCELIGLLRVLIGESGTAEGPPSPASTTSLVGKDPLRSVYVGECFSRPGRSP